MDSRADALIRSPELHTAAQVLGRPSPVPAVPGVYAWYFDKVPNGVPTDGCIRSEHATLLYVGISPKRPSPSGGALSRQSLRTRITYHYRGNAAGSTLRLTVGSLIAADLGIGLRRVGSGQRLTFSTGERELSGWLAAHAQVCWVPHPEPWILEDELIETLEPPLNLAGNHRSEFLSVLKHARAHQR